MCVFGISKQILNLFRMGLFRAAYKQGRGRQKDTPSPKSLTQSTMKKLDIVISYLKKIQKKYTNHVTHFLSSASISIFSLEISNFHYIRKYRYTSKAFFKGFFNKYVCSFDDVSKNDLLVHYITGLEESYSSRRVFRR